MSFTDASYLSFFAAVWALYWVLGASRVAQNVVLVAASLAFYGWIHPWLVVLLLGLAGLGYVSANRIAHARAAAPDADSPGTGWLVVTLVGSLVTLGFFKYFDGFRDGFAAAAAFVGLSIDPLTWPVFLPAGLSFYTFQTMAYVIDVWRGQVTARRSVLDHVLFVVFFPQLLAGPIARAASLFPQVEQARRLDVERVASGLSLFLWGAFKKIVIAETITPYVNILYAHPDPTAAMIWSAALGFSLQAVADFSGYTDMARGSARLLGFELAENFDHPYLAHSPMEFWNRWHISFSSWLRDYVYMPASFSPWVRRWVNLPGLGDWSPFWHTARSLALTMLVSGLWHGTTWNFVLWGGYYAVIGTVWVGIQQRIPRKFRKSRDWTPVLLPVMFVHTVVGMMIFRESSVPRLVSHFLRNPVGGDADTWIVAAGMLSLCVLLAVPLWLAIGWERWVWPRLQDSPWRLAAYTTGSALAIVAWLTFHRPVVNDFVYFQF